MVEFTIVGHILERANYSILLEGYCVQISTRTAGTGEGPL